MPRTNLYSKKQTNTIDIFLKGDMEKIIKNNQKNRVIPFIKVPMSSGFQPFMLPIKPIFMYPLNPEFRQYQYQIARQCVCYNTLVCLPTGLGKTHIAATMLVNYATWFPSGKLFFLAPTRPLVAQQRNSLKYFSQQIDLSKSVEINGQVNYSKRKVYYSEKQIFFCTPQTFENDLKEQRIDSQKIVLIIFDQAHRGIGNYSYCKIIEIIQKKQNKKGYRIISLSATPGNTIQKIQQVIQKLHISKLQIKLDNDPEIQKYFHFKQIIQIYITSTSIIKQVQNILNYFAKQPINILCNIGLCDYYFFNKINSGSYFQLLQQFNLKINFIQQTKKRLAYSCLKFIKFLIDSKKSLLDQGYQTFKNKFIIQLLQTKQNKNSNENSNQKNRLNFISEQYRLKIINTQQFKRIQTLFNFKNNALTHPKLEKLRLILIKFFTDNINTENKNSKVIVFTQFRNTAVEIKRYLSSTQLIKCELFYGQSKSKIYNEYQQTNVTQNSSSNYTIMQMSQKQQLELLRKYKKNEINTLISTSIGEEGLDIGEVDCIVCYDGGMSPIRMIQRMGRTGRKKNGKVYLLLMQGQQSHNYKRTVLKSKRMKQLLKKNKYNYYAYNSSMFEEYFQIPVHLIENKMKSQNQNNVNQINISNNNNNEIQQNKDQKQQQQQYLEHLQSLQNNKINQDLNSNINSQQDQQQQKNKIETNFQQLQKMEQNIFQNQQEEEEEEEEQKKQQKQENNNNNNNNYIKQQQQYNNVQQIQKINQNQIQLNLLKQYLITKKSNKWCYKQQQIKKKKEQLIENHYLQFQDEECINDKPKEILMQKIANIDNWQSKECSQKSYDSSEIMGILEQRNQHHSQI